MKRGRPKQTVHYRTKVRSIRVPEREWIAWMLHAARLGVSVSEWLRGLALAAVTVVDAKPPSPSDE